MSENTKDTTEKGIENVESVLTKGEQFIENNQKTLTIVVGVIVGLIAIFILAKKFYFAPLEEEAQSQMFTAEKYFELDSFKLALNGNGNFSGFNQIIEDYNFTKTKNLAYYYAGVCNLQMAQYEVAIENLEKYNSDDTYIGTVALGAIGDAYSQLKNYEKAIKYYKKAIKREPNQMLTPIYLMKAANLLEMQNDFEGALDLYRVLETTYSNTNEGRSVAKYIERAKQKI